MTTEVRIRYICRKCGKELVVGRLLSENGACVFVSNKNDKWEKVGGYYLCPDCKL